MFFGEYYHQLDNKGRLRIPAKLRNELGNKYCVTMGIDHSLFVFSMEKFEELGRKLKEVPLGDVEAQKAIGALFFNAFDVEEDAQGRFVLPQKLRKYAGIEKNIVVRGVMDRIEILSEERANADDANSDMTSALQKLKDYNI